MRYHFTLKKGEWINIYGNQKKEGVLRLKIARRHFSYVSLGNEKTFLMPFLHFFSVSVIQRNIFRQVDVDNPTATILTVHQVAARGNLNTLASMFSKNANIIYEKDQNGWQ